MSLWQKSHLWIKLKEISWKIIREPNWSYHNPSESCLLLVDFNPSTLISFQGAILISLQHSSFKCWYALLFPDILALFISFEMVPDSDTLYMMTNGFPLTDTPNGKLALAFLCYHSPKPCHTNKRCFAVPKLWAVNILCYLLFGTQSVKDIPTLWRSKVLS